MSSTHFERMAIAWHISDLVETRRQCDILLARPDRRVPNTGGKLPCNYASCLRPAHCEGLCKQHFNLNRKRRLEGQRKRKAGGLRIKTGPRHGYVRMGYGAN